MTLVLDRPEADTVPGGTEELVVFFDRETGTRAVVAIDDTTLGPGLGGVRYRPYPDEAAAVAEARRLARVMTLKNACAGIPYGGAKSVILDDGVERRRAAVMGAFGRFVARLGGSYVPGVDMGTNVDDLALVGQRAGDVSCDHVDPSPYTALGVLAALRAAAASAGWDDVGGLRVLVQGAGHVGRSLALQLAADGARVAVSDVDADRAASVSREIGGTVVPVERVVDVECDVLAPCATAGLVDDGTVDRLRCRLLVGAANDVLAHRRLARALAERGVLYVPDFVANAGGVVQIHAARAGWGEDATRRAVLAIGDRVTRLIERSRESGRTPLEVAEAMASQRLGHRVEIPS